MKSKTSVSKKNTKVLTNNIAVIRKDMESLREVVKRFPRIMEKEINTARLASERLVSGASNLDGIVFNCCYLLYCSYITVYIMLYVILLYCSYITVVILLYCSNRFQSDPIYILEPAVGTNMIL